MNYFALIRWAVEHRLKVEFIEENFLLGVRLTWFDPSKVLPINRSPETTRKNYGVRHLFDPEMFDYQDYLAYSFNRILSRIVEVDKSIRKAMK